MVGTTAIVSVVPQEQVTDMAVKGGTRLQRGDKINGVTLAPTEKNAACFVYLADTPDGLAALEHELWHCRNGRWHQ